MDLPPAPWPVQRQRLISSMPLAALGFDTGYIIRDLGSVMVRELVDCSRDTAPRACILGGVGWHGRRSTESDGEGVTVLNSTLEVQTRGVSLQRSDHSTIGSLFRMECSGIDVSQIKLDCNMRCPAYGWYDEV